MYIIIHICTYPDITIYSRIRRHKCMYIYIYNNIYKCIHLYILFLIYKTF